MIYLIIWKVKIQILKFWKMKIKKQKLSYMLLKIIIKKPRKYFSFKKNT